MNRYLFVLLSLLFALNSLAAGVSDIALTPTSIAVKYQIGGALPAAQPLAIKATGTTALNFTLTVTQPAACTAPCLTVSAASGTTPASLKVYINPTGLAAGTYNGSIAINAPAAVTPNQTVPVSLTVGDQPALLSASSTTLAFTYTTGGGTTSQSQPVVLTTSGGALTASVAVSGGTWLKASPTGTIALLGLPQTLTITADAAGVAPSTSAYKGTVTITSSNAQNKSVVINVTLTVSAGIPTIAATNGIWPPGAPAGSTKPVTVTITGTNYTSASTAISGTTALTNITVVNPTTMLATIPVSLLASKGTLPIVIKTPSAAADSAPGSFTVYDPAVPQIWAVVNGASYNPGVASPGEVITIYGAGLGPSTLKSFSGTSLPTSLGDASGNTSVKIDGQDAPLLYTSATQVSCVVPLAVAPGKASGAVVDVNVTYNGTQSTKAFQVNVADADPGIFLLDTSGQGAILNIDTTVTPNNYTVNDAKNAATAGSWVAIYATGFGVTSCADVQGSPCDNPAPTEAQFVGGGLVTPTGALAVTIGGQTVTSPVGVVPVGSIVGLLQINAQVPAGVTAGTAVPVVISIGGIKSVGLATMVVK